MLLLVPALFYQFWLNTSQANILFLKKKKNRDSRFVTALL